MSNLHTHDILPVKFIYLDRIGDLALWLATNQLQPNTCAQIHNALIRQCCTAGYDLLTSTSLPPVHIRSVEQFSCWFSYFKRRGMLTDYLQAVSCTHSSIVKNFLASYPKTEEMMTFSLKHGHCPSGDPEEVVTAAFDLGYAAAFDTLLSNPTHTAILAENYEAFLDAWENFDSPSRRLCDWTIDLIVDRRIKTKKKVYRLLVVGCSDAYGATLVKWWRVADAAALCLAVDRRLTMTVSTILTTEGDLSMISLLAESVADLDEELIKSIAARGINLTHPRDSKKSLDALVPYFPVTTALFSRVSDVNKRHLLLTTPIGRSLSLMEITQHITVDELPESVWRR